MAENRNAQQVREITDKLEQGIKELFESERFKEYLRTMSKFYHYSFNNTLLIAMQKPEATLIAGYTAWQRNFDRHVMKGEKGIKILAPAPYKTKVKMEKIDPKTQKPMLDADGKPITELVEVMRPAFKVVSVFDVSQTDGKELPDIVVDELTGSVENYAAFFDALKQESPVPIAFEDIPGGAKGYYHLEDRRIAIQEGMSEVQTVKTAIHEIAHAKLHALDQPDPDPQWKVVMVSEGGAKYDFQTAFETEADAIAAAEAADWRFVDENQFEWRLEVEEDTSAIQAARKDRHTKEVEAEAVAYTVCQRYGIETSDYSFGYIAGWSSDKETKELKGSLETIRKTAAEMIESIDDKLKVLLAEKAIDAAAQEQASIHSKVDIPVYREYANYAFEAGEIESYKASRDANIACRDAIEAAITENFSDNRLASEIAVTSVLEQFSAERVAYVLANTIQQKDHDGRIHPSLKEWAKTIEVCPDSAQYFIVDKVNPGLLDLFVIEFNRQTDVAERESEADHARDPEVVAWEKDEITSFTVTVNEVKSPLAAQTEEAPIAKPHRLTPEEKKIKEAVMDTLKAQIAHRNDGMLATYRSSDQSFKLMMEYKVRIDGNTVTQNGEPLFAIHRRHSSRKTQGCYRELTPTLEYIRREQKQEKPSIRDQLKAAAKTQPERKPPARARKHDMGLE